MNHISDCQSEVWEGIIPFVIKQKASEASKYPTDLYVRYCPEMPVPNHKWLIGVLSHNPKGDFIIDMYGITERKLHSITQNKPIIYKGIRIVGKTVTPSK